MLILNRKTNQTVFIGDKITVTVLEIKEHQVRLGINAPKDVPVHREEIYRLVQSEKEVANG